LKLTSATLFLLLLFSACSTTSGNTATNSRVEAQPFNGQSYRTQDGRSAITLISSDELEYRVPDGRTLLCKYTNQQNALRVIVTALGTQEVLYFRRVPNGLVSNDGILYLNPSALAEVQRQAELAIRAQREAQAAEQRRLAESQQLAAIAAQREAEVQRLADERARKEAPDKLRALLTAHPALGGTYATGFGPTKLTLRVISFNSGSASLAAEVDFPAAGYNNAHLNRAEGDVSGATLNLTVFDSQEVTKPWMLMKLQFSGSAPPAHPNPSLVGQWFNVGDDRGFPLLFDLK
jgi:hypothetical protein